MRIREMVAEDWPKVFAIFNKAIETLDQFHFDTHNYQAFPKDH